MLAAEVMAYYLRGGERDRLSARAGRLEFLRTRDVLTLVLPSAPAEVLDVGGATGALASGLHRNPHSVPRWFTSAYFHHPDEAAGEATEAGLTVDRVVPVEGPLWMLGSVRLDELLGDESMTGLMLELLRKLEEEPSLLGASSHHLTIARSS